MNHTETAETAEIGQELKLGRKRRRRPRAPFLRAGATATLRRVMIRTALASFALLLAACTAPDYGRPLPDGWPALLELKRGEKRPDYKASWSDRDEILPALERSIEWYQRPSAAQHFPVEGVTHERALASLVRFREHLLEATSAEDFDARLALDFSVYKSAGWNGKGGGVLFTGYCTPILQGSIVRDTTYAFPLYGLPEDLVKGEEDVILGQRQADGSLTPYPTRRTIEANGLLAGKDLELVYLKDPLDAFIAHVNGSAVIELPDGEQRRFGYSGKNGREYSSLGRMLVADGHIPAKDVSLQTIRDLGARDPELLNEYILRDDSFVFFLPIEGEPKG